MSSWGDRATIKELREQITTLQKELHEKDLEIAKLQGEIFSLEQLVEDYRYEARNTYCYNCDR